MSPTLQKAVLFDPAISAGIVALCIIAVSCANPIPPSGGPKDTTSPKLIEAESTPNFLTQFDREEIVLTFDEWIQLKDPNQQIVISPPLPHQPNIALHGKAVRIRFHSGDTLRPQTTYTINFGSSIADLNEGNVLDQYKYVFSTGTFIDSLALDGTVTNALTGEPAKGVLILLNDNLSDTAFKTLLPSYFTKSDTAGKWRIENIRSDTFKVYALVDKNSNYRFDQVGESIGFLDQPVILPDSSGRKFNISLFDEEAVISVLTVDQSPGLTKIALTGEPTAFSLERISDPDAKVYWQQTEDTVYIWNPSRDSMRLAVSDDYKLSDSLLIPGYKGPKPPVDKFQSGGRTVTSAEPFAILSSIPLMAVRKENVVALLDDSIAVTGLTMMIDTTDDKRVLIRYPWEEAGTYSVTIPNGALTNIFGTANDSLQFRFQVASAGKTGNIYLSVEGLVDTLHYVVLLMHGENKVDQALVSGKTEVKVSFTRMPPQTYQVRVVEDANANGRWDTGNFAQRKQPERVMNQSLEPLRAGWDLDATITWKEKQN